MQIASFRLQYNNQISNTSVNNISINNINNTSLFNTLNVSTLNNSNITSTISNLSIDEFINLVQNSISYCLCPAINLETFNFNNPKPNVNIYKNKNKHNHPENQELPPIENKNKQYCLVLDMDETLIHFFDVIFLIFDIYFIIIMFELYT